MSKFDDFLDRVRQRHGRGAEIAVFATVCIGVGAAFLPLIFIAFVSVMESPSSLLPFGAVYLAWIAYVVITSLRD